MGPVLPMPLPLLELSSLAESDWLGEMLLLPFSVTCLGDT